MMYWTFDASRQDRQEILFGPYLLYLTSYLLPPLSAKMQANAFKPSTGNTYVDASKIVQPRGTYLIHPLQVSSLPRR